MSQHDHNDPNRNEDMAATGIIMFVIAVILIALLMIGLSGCSSMPKIDWSQVVQQVKFYYDQIPPEQIEQLKEALENIK